MSFEFELGEMKKIWEDLEKQLVAFNEVVPYERNSVQVYSPKLVNIMLSAGPQIEGMVKILVKELKVQPESNKVLDLIKDINKNAILSVQRISSTLNGLLFTPFGPAELLWWKSYNATKHELPHSLFEIKYQTVMDSMAALAVLHRISDIVKKFPTQIETILDRQYWNSPVRKYRDEDGYEMEQEIEGPKLWKSLAFKISTEYSYE